MPVNLRDEYWVPTYTVQGHYRHYPKGHSKVVARQNAAKLKARHRRAAKLKQQRKRKRK